MSFLELRSGIKGLVQNSPEWYEWRRHHIGASDVPSIMGTSDFGNAHGVFVAKVHGALENQPFNYATARGKSLEPIIVARFEEAYDCRLTSPSLEFEDWPILSASLDGWHERDRFVVECKAPSRIKHIGALCGIVPDTYVDQVQAQLLVAKAEKAYYVSYHPDEPKGFDLAVVEVMADRTRQQQILERCQRFWEIVQNGTWDEGF